MEEDDLLHQPRLRVRENALEAAPRGRYNSPLPASRNFQAEELTGAGYITVLSHCPAGPAPGHIRTEEETPSRR